MKYTYFFLLFFCQNLLAQSIIPQPVELKNGTDFFTLTEKTTFGFNNEKAKKAANLFAEKITKAIGFRLKESKKANIQFLINDIENPVLGKEGYTIDVTKKNIFVRANQAEGLFYGLQTLYQIFPAEIEKSIENQTVVNQKWNIQCVQIKDYPRFTWRGLMLDCSRHFFKKEDVKRYLDLMARYKYNTFHWHLTDDEGWRIEIKSLPKLTEIGACRVQRYGKFGNYEAPKEGEAATDCGFYTQEDIKEIVAYAAERHISVLPEIDVPGHSMAAIAAYPELACSKDPKIKVSPGQKFAEWYDGGKFKMLIDNTLNPSDPKVYDFLDKVFTEVATLFPHQYIHAGGDECYKGYWEQNADCQNLMKQEGLKDAHELQSFFTKKVEKIIESKGKKLIGWDEILEGGLAPNAAVMSWQGTKGGAEAAKQGHYVVMSPNDFTYIDLIQGDKLAEPDATSYKTVRLSKTYAYEPTDGVDAKYILGGQANLWTEKAPTIRHAEYLTFPRAWAVADIFWSPKESKNWDNFVLRMEKQFERADLAGINYARSAYDAILTPRFENGRLMVEMSTEINGLDIFYTINETEPDTYTTKYNTPIFLPEGNDVTLRVATYRNGKKIGKTINFPRENLVKRVKK